MLVFLCVINSMVVCLMVWGWIFRFGAVIGCLECRPSIFSGACGRAAP